MADKVGRNDPCPCGSGKKYKQCHWGKDTDGSPAEVQLDADGAPIAESGWNKRQIALALLALVIGGAIVLAVLGMWKWAIAVGGAGSILVGILYISMDPPPPSDNPSNPSGLNFGN